MFTTMFTTFLSWYYHDRLMHILVHALYFVGCNESCASAPAHCFILLAQLSPANGYFRWVPSGTSWYVWVLLGTYRYLRVTIN